MSALSPNLKLNRRGFADTDAPRAMRLARSGFRDRVGRAVQKTYPTTQAAHHFRTPSPCGQPDLTPRLSTSFLHCNPLIQQGFAGFSTASELSCARGYLMSCAEADQKPAKKGTEQCTSRHWLSPSRPARRWPHVVTRWPNRPSSAQVLAPQPPSFSTESPSRAPSSARRATFFTVRPTPESATKRSRRIPHGRAPRDTRGPFSHMKPVQASACAGFFASLALFGATFTCHKRTPICSRRS